MFTFKNKLLLCFVILNNVWFVQSGYGYGFSHNTQHTSGREQSDVGVPKYLPDIFKSGEFPMKFGSLHGNTKTFGVKSFKSSSHGSMEDLFSSREASANTGTYKGGCVNRPETPANTMLKCSMYSGCRVTCMPEYQFEDGQSSHILICTDGKWSVQGWSSIPACAPICLPPCQHNGICVAPGQCDCAENFNGPQCQFEKKPCLNYPPLPKNSKRSCTSTSCTISCAKGHQFPDGSSITNLMCKEGTWLPTRQDMPSVPDCQPVCQPPCMNGGNCLSLNVCQCPQDFRGPQCQYSSDACAASKLGFNGGYNCVGDKDALSCSLTCPTGIHFNSKPVDVYTCAYSMGVFLPQPIPMCIYGDKQVMIMGGSSQAFYKSKNYSKSHDNYEERARNVNHGDWSHSKTGGTYSAGSYGFTNDSSPQYGQGVDYVTVEPIIPKPGTCFTWGGAHFKTFDGKVYSFDSPCRHILVRDGQDNTFSIAVQNVDERRRVFIFLQDKEYTLEANDDGGVLFKSTKHLLPIPAQLPGLRVQMAGHLVQLVLETLGVAIKWDAKQLVQVDVTESLWGRTEGLCGKIDGDPDNDAATKEGVIPKSIITLADSWKVKKIGDEICEDTPSEKHACSLQSKKLATEAEIFCTNLVSKSRFVACSKIMDISLLLESCKWDYCGCPPHQSREECGCDSLAVYAGQCTAQGIKSLAKWRDVDTCMMNCTGGRIYQWCGPPVQLSCGSPNPGAEEAQPNAACTEGCFCPQGTLLQGGQCVTKDQCPCRLRGKQFAPGVSVPKDCNTCTCQNGEWVCTQVSCGARCSAVGDPHYQTFDGRRFNFMGQCTYHLVKGDDYSIEGENVACSGAISEGMNLASDDDIFDMPACTKAVTIRYGKTIVQLKQGRVVVVNGKDCTKLPAKLEGMKIRSVSSLFVLVQLPNGLKVWWDGMTRAHIDAPSSFRGKTKGLCGTFNSNQKDDFLTPEGDVEQAVIPFANKWKTGEMCGDISDKEDPHPCDTNKQNKATAGKLCEKLKGHLFADCHWSVDVTPYYEDCMYDMCSCEGPLDRCLCPMIGAYATECARQGVQVQWRLNVKECEVHCPGGQTYQVCGDSCARSCDDLREAWEDRLDASQEARCHPQCVEGCNCPVGQALDSRGECVPQASCACRHAGLEFPPQYKEVRPGSKQQELCTCVGAAWECRPATPEEIVAYPRAADIKDKCSAARNEEFTTCEPAEPLTCKDMHRTPLGSTNAECRPGCQCKKGFVLDSVAKKCIKPEECPCHHGGRSYPDGETMQEDCNTCKCNAGKWSCEKRPCAGVCSTWGDSHFHTFDGRSYDFQGVCTYLLTKGSFDTSHQGFSVEIQNEVCGTSGVTCSKAITLKVGSGPDAEVITFTKDKPLPESKHLKRIKLRHAGLFVFAEVPSLGIVVQWDKGTRVYVKAEPKWKGRLKGLCGNYNDNEEDDFQTPSGGVSEASARLFGDSWKLKPHCPPSSEVQDTCALHPERQTWSVQRCGALKRAPFSLCHSEVPPGDYLRRCERDTCACGLGGDCDCLCTALAAYAHECASRGVPVKWRTQELCPMQCDETCTNYSPCISACPLETCDNTLFYSQITEMCPQDTCVEGCVSKKSCPKDQVLSNTTAEECVPRSSCKPVCLTLPNGKVLLEGEVMEEDQCHSCHCSRGTKVCKGQPCSTLPPGTTPAMATMSTPRMMEQQIKCTNGWTEWISNSVPLHSKDSKNLKTTKTSKPFSVEVEALPSLLEMKNRPGGICPTDMMVDVECRTVEGHQTAKETGLDAECSLEKGLFCRQPSAEPCPDFEIRVLCKCDRTDEITTEIFEMGTPKQQYPEALSHLVCDESRPNQEFPGDCALFLQCAPGMGPPEHPNLVEKTCGPHMLYNPHTMTCDWPQSVIAIKPDCGVAVSVHQTIGSTISFVEEFEVTKSPCEPGKVWSDCAVNCLKVCLFYDHFLKAEGKCSGGQKCIAGCVDESVTFKPCGKGYFWRDAKTCVSLADCTCVSADGKPVKPGAVVHQGPCTVCQCLNNEYVCDESSCKRTKPSEKLQAIKEKPSSSENVASVEEEEENSLNVSVVLRPSTLSPPPECDPDRYTDIMMGDAPLPDDAYTSSSYLGPAFQPQNAKLNGKVSETSGGSWSPKESIPGEWIQVNMHHKEPVYGIVMQGSTLFDQYVTSYEVMYSDNGHHFTHVNKPDNTPQVFRGPMDNTTPIKQMFYVPFEAQYLRVLPKTWHDTIAIRMELIGCSDATTEEEMSTTPTYVKKTTLPTTTVKQVKEPECKEPQKLMALPAMDVQVSSSKPDSPKKFLSLDQPHAWQPLTNSPKEWIQFDFGKVQNITGVITKGGPDGWVSAYKVKYSPDGESWSPIVDSDREILMFPANYDHDTPVTNSFEFPVHARYLKIMPAKWNKNINIRAEPQGCNEPQTVEFEQIPEFTIGPEVEIEAGCSVCPGLVLPAEGCSCESPSMYDGEQCVPQAKCPCMVGHIPYSIGATYVTDGCETCTCTLGGYPACEKKTCPKCKNGLVPKLSDLCQCSCTPCPAGTRLCPTSEVCIPEDSWCDGAQDCPDDELNCEASTTLAPTTSVAEVTELQCPVATCPKGYKVVEKKSAASKQNLELTNDGQVTSDSLFAQPTKSGRKGYQRYFKGGAKGGSNPSGGIKTSGYRPAKVPLQRQTLERPIKAEPPAKKECMQWRCVSSRPPPSLVPKGGQKPTLPPCPAPRCPPEYIISMDNEELDEYDCPKYSCSPPARRDAVCNVTCRIFNTFDGTEFQYDICNHILARDADMNTWDVTLQKNCSKELCVNELVISQGQDQVRFRPDLTVEYNGYMYTVDQTRKIGFQTQTFAISRLGETLFYISTKYGFWVTYDNKKNIRIGVAGKLYGRVDGLCGFFNGEPLDDRRKPDGSPARSTEEFGDSWAHKDSPEVCEVTACPINLQNKAWDMCKVISSEMFSSCASSIDLEKARSRCLEAVCECMQNSGAPEDSKGSSVPSNSKSKTCLCEALQTFITGCQAADQTVNLQGWRTETSCPAVCSTPLVHYDCFRRRCELSCSSLQEDDPCPTTPGVCFSGCFCPEGMVRKGENCVPPTECRDCVCDGFGKPQFVTYDRSNFTFNGNCTYIASRDKSSDGAHAFQVYVTNGECPNNPDAICTVALHIIFENHTLHIQKIGDELITTVDGMKVQHYPVLSKWLHLQEISGNDITLLIPSVQLEVASIFHNMAFTIKVPSMLYGGKTEGLCGNCDGDADNDLGQSDEEVRKFGLGWRAPRTELELLDIQEDNCVEKPKDECWPLPPDQDPCFKIMDDMKFGKCHPVVDPIPFLSSCQQDLCSTHKQLGLCVSLEAYARQCERAGICLDWRREDFCPYKCENDLSYESCGLGCQITCESYEKYTKKPSSCHLPKSEGCFCPEGKVAVNNTCIPHSKCFPCDSAGHYVGDTWQVDECTSCSCGKKGGVTCVERSCAQASVCTPGLVAQQIAKPAGQCCPEFICIAVPTDMPHCDEPVKMECGFGQILKLETVATRCPTFVCQCKPLDECDPILPDNEVELLEPGMERVVDSSGCCPQASLVCKPDKCPVAPKCPPHHKPRPNHKDKECCPTYTCEPPTDKCLYDMEYESSPLGGETKRPAGQVETIPKSMGATWQDGPCRSCLCKKLGGSSQSNQKDQTATKAKAVLRAVCSVTQCPAIPELEDFVTESVGIPFTCCSKPKYSACKYDGTVYKIDEEWKSDTNPCVIYKCSEKEDGTLEKKTIVKQCDKNCQQGWKYTPSPNPDKICCGQCTPEACIVGGLERKIGEKWTSKDYCTDFVCLNKNGTLQVQSMEVSCPAVSKNMREEFELEETPVQGKCCKKVKTVACKVDGKIYKVGDVWKSDSDPCVSFTCMMKDDGTLEKQMSVKQCEVKCKQGWKYSPSNKPETVCCGECLPVSCVVSGVERKIGEEWTSNDFCTKFICLNKNGVLQVQSVGVTCPAVSKIMREEFELKETPVEGQCCKKVIPVACKVQDKVYKVGEQWASETDPCVSFICEAKGDGTLEKHTKITQCDMNCKKGWKYNPSPKPYVKCCGECLAVSCMVSGVERKIGEEWTSDDLCTKFTCLNKNGSLQVQSMEVSCPLVSKNMREEFELKETPVEGQCCKKVIPVACKVEGKIFKIGEEWKSPSDPCVSYMCTSKEGNFLEKQMKVKQCDMRCKQGWKYSPSNKPESVCCGECLPVACVVSGVERKIGEEWTSEDYCNKYTCLNKNGVLQVQSVKVNCPAISEKMREDFKVEEKPVKGECCPKIKTTACKDKGQTYEIGAKWVSAADPCVLLTCVLNDGDGSLEKQTTTMQCEKKCKQGWKYKPSSSPTTVCCGECVPVACVVDGKEKRIGEEWTSIDYCTNFFCLNKTGTLQVQAVSVSCPSVPKLMQEEFVVDMIPVKGKCCKKIVPVSCKVDGEIYREGSSWRSPDGDPCKNVTCTRDASSELVRTESTENCRTDCSVGWDYQAATDPHTCCGQCVQTACVVEGVLYKAGQTWMSPDNCTQFSCDKQGDQLAVSMQQESCPDVSACNPKNIYYRGCCQHCNITSLPQKSCMPEDLPAKETIGMIHQVKHPHGLCVNKKPLIGFKECKGACNSGTIYNDESSTHENDCKCCQASKYDGLIMEMTCEDGHVFKKQVAVPSACDCLACIGEAKTKSKTAGRKVAGVKSGRPSFAPDKIEDLDDVELF